VAVNGWVVDKSTAVRAADPTVASKLAELAEGLYVCPVGELEILYSTRSAGDYDDQREGLHARFQPIAAPPDILERALRLQRDLAHHHGLWHRIPIPDLLIAEIALHHGLGVIHVDHDFERIADVRPLQVLRVG
jgi:predicted nucleic acid-binding protein